MNLEETSSHDRPRGDTRRIAPVVVGTYCGILSAVAYTAANASLRAVSDCDPVWVSCVKAFPTVVLVGPWLIVRMARSQTIVRSLRPLGWLVAAGLVGQLVGNVLFQWTLGVIGMALAVPLNLGSMILSGALVGYFFLKEAVPGRTVVALAVLLVSIGVLSWGAPTAGGTVAAIGDGVPASTWGLVAAVAACCSGIAYSALGVSIRHACNEGTPATTVVTLVCSVGVVSLGAMSVAKIGTDAMWATDRADLAMMLLAGLCNAIAFVSLTKALQLTGIVHVNGLNASQTAMAALAGILLFHEPVTAALIVGVCLAVVGLLLMVGPRRNAPVEIPPAETAPRDEPTAEEMAVPMSTR